MTRNNIFHKFTVVMLVVLPLVGTIAAIALLWNQYVFASDLVLLFSFYAITAMGITIGYHRMLTHQSFQAPAIVRAFFLLAGSMAFEGAPDVWAAAHIKHHAHADDEGDPHSPLDGFWHAHFGWLFSLKNFPQVRQYAPHLLEDPVVLFVSRTTPLWMGVSLLIPYLIGGWTGLLWGGVVRIFLGTHVTWSVNSVCHTFGRREFETSDESRNEWIVGLLAFGEGWHNNHHAFPRSAFHGLKWWQFDMSGIVIAFCEKIGLAWDVQRISEEAMEAKKGKNTAVVTSLAELRSQLALAVKHAKEELHAMAETFVRQHVAEEKRAEIHVAYAEAALRLNAIQENMAKATHLKKQRLVAYMSEVQELAAAAKKKISEAAQMHLSMNAAGR